MPLPTPYLSKLKELELNPIDHYQVAANTYDAIKKGAEIQPEKTAIQYMLKGNYYRADKIPLSAKLAHKALGEVARPYRSITFNELFSGVTQSANLLHDLNVGKNDVVSLLLPNFIETHFALWGAEAAGIANPVNPLLEADVIRDILNAAGTKVLITLGKAPGNDIWQKVMKIKDQVPTLETVLVLFGPTDTKNGIVNFEKSLQKYPADHLQSLRKINAEDIASLFHTGGTTGTPKIAKHTHANEVANATMMSLVLAPEKNDKALVGLPLFHVNAAIASGLMPFMNGVPIILAGPAGFRSEGVVDNFFNIIEQHKVSFFSAVPTALGSLLNVPSEHNDLSSLKFAISGAAPIPVETFNQFQKKTGIKLLEGYGLTEASCASSLTPPNSKNSVGSIGMRLPFSKIKIVMLDGNDEFLREANTNEIGVLSINGPNVFPGYLDPAHDKNLWVKIKGRTWLNSGDLGRMDEEGYLWLTGRKKELIIRGGHNIDPKAIEEPVACMKGIELVAAVGRPDSYAGEVPVVYVTVNDKSITADAIKAYAQSHINERAAVPKQVIILNDMPVTAVGKIFKPQLTWWQIESVIKEQIVQCFEGDTLKRCKVNVVKHKQYGCHANIKVPKPTDTERIEKLARALEGFNFRYEVEWS